MKLIVSILINNFASKKTREENTIKNIIVEFTLDLV